MSDDCYSVLCEVVRIANRGEPDFSRSCKDILRLLAKVFGLKGAELLLCNDPSRCFSEHLVDSGPYLFRPCNQQVEGPVSAALADRCLVRDDQRLFVPLYDCSRLYGVLDLSLPPGFFSFHSFEKLCQVVAMQLRGLLQRRQVAAGERRRMAQLALISDLERSVTKAGSVKELLEIACRTVQLHAEASCVVLRPIYGNTLLGDRTVQIPQAWKGLRTPLLKVEEELAAQVAADNRSVFKQHPFVHVPGGELLPAAVAAVPLVFQQHAWGIFTIFEQADAGPLALASDHSARGVLVLVAEQIAQAIERLTAVEQLEEVSKENATKLQEISLLYRTFRAVHSTLHLDELMLLVLAAATVENGAGFERAMFFLVNERSGFLQGMLGVGRAEARTVLPPGKGLAAWKKPRIDETVRTAQRQEPFCREVRRQRLALDQLDHPLVQAVLQERVVLVSAHEQAAPAFAALKEQFNIGHCACAPLVGHDRVLGVMLVDSPGSSAEISPERRRFLELFANQAAQAMENSLLVQRLEESHRHLRETQEQMIQGEKMAALGETAASVTHELRNPLVSIGGFANRLADLLPADSKEGEYSQIIVREVRRMEEMLGNILGFSKKQMLCLTDCKLVGILDEVLALEAEPLQRASIAVNKEICRDLPPIKGDEQKLRQVLLNLVSNARQTMAGGGTLTVRAYGTVLRGDPAVALEVEDSGGGIEPAVMRNIFNPFFTTRQSGTGLGLSIVHRIIEHHHGDIEVQNGERGARFIIRLSVARTEQKPRLPGWPRPF
ncbi:MAG: ATP-binding protein [Syntrophotaleaceae bacterium]